MQNKTECRHQRSLSDKLIPAIPPSETSLTGGLIFKFFILSLHF